jgi:kynurenine formamidase
MGRHFDEGEPYLGVSSGVPGPGETAACWLAGRQPVAVGADSIAFEQIPAGRGHALLPAHRILLVEAGIYILEYWNSSSSWPYGHTNSSSSARR